MSAFTRLTASLALALSPCPVGAQEALTFDGDTCTLTVSERLAFRGPSAFFTATLDGGFVLDGDVTLVTPFVELPLPEAYLSLHPAETDGPFKFEAVGSVRPDLANLPGLGQYITGGPSATFGLATRETLQDLLGGELPLPENPSPDDPEVRLEPAYVFFHFDAGVELDLPLAEFTGIDAEALGEELGYSLPEAAATLIFDPTDPFFYFAMDDMLAKDDADDDSGEGSDDDARDGSKQESDIDMKYQLDAIGFSWLGGIPFAPDTSWGLPEGSGELQGNILVDGAFTVYGVKIDGEIVIGTIFDGLELGANAEVEVSFESGDYGITVPLGEASVAMEIVPHEIDMALSGVLKLKEITLDAGDGVAGQLIPDEIPLSVTGNVQAAAYLHTNGLGWVDAGIVAEGDFHLAPYGSNLWGIDLVGEFSLDSSGVQMGGCLSGQVHPSLQFSGEVSVEASLPYVNPRGWYIEVAGNLRLGGVDLGSSQVLINNYGVFIEGQYTTPFSTIQLAGELTVDGPYLAGYAAVNLGQQGVGEVLQAAEQAVANAQANLASIDEEMEVLVAFIQAERAATKEGIEVAQGLVNAARSAVDSLQSSIDYHDARIRARRSEIQSRFDWAMGQAWYNQAWGWSVYAAESAWRNVEIAGHTASLVTLNAARLAATLALTGPETALALAEALHDTFPIHLDARVVGLELLRNAALVALEVPEALLGSIPPLPDSLIAEMSFSMSLNGLTGMAMVSLDGQPLAGADLAIREAIALTIELPVFGQVSLEI